VLTAAHCFLEFIEADLLAGIHNFITDDPVYEYNFFPSDTITHSQYNRLTHLNDIGLVRTARQPIQFNTAVQPVILAPRAWASNDLTNSVGRIAGW
jgi:hypothetical protein